MLYWFITLAVLLFAGWLAWELWNAPTVNEGEQATLADVMDGPADVPCEPWQADRRRRMFGQKHGAKWN